MKSVRERAEVYLDKINDTPDDYDILIDTLESLILVDRAEVRREVFQEVLSIIQDREYSFLVYQMYKKDFDAIAEGREG